MLCLNLLCELGVRLEGDLLAVRCCFKTCWNWIGWVVVTLEVGVVVLVFMIRCGFVWTIWMLCLPSNCTFCCKVVKLVDELTFRMVCVGCCDDGWISIGCWISWVVWPGCPPVKFCAVVVISWNCLNCCWGWLADWGVVVVVDVACCTFDPLTGTVVTIVVCDEPVGWFNVEVVVGWFDEIMPFLT